MIQAIVDTVNQHIDNINDKLTGKVPTGHVRSPEWPRVRKEHLVKFPTCAVCSGSTKLQVHHKHPFHLHPDMELNPENLITLCEAGGLNCHLTFGHLGNFKSFNNNVSTDAATWRIKIANRPDGKDV